MLLHSYLGIYTCTEHIYIDTCMYCRETRRVAVDMMGRGVHVAT